VQNLSYRIGSSGANFVANIFFQKTGFRSNHLTFWNKDVDHESSAAGNDRLFSVWFISSGCCSCLLRARCPVVDCWPPAEKKMRRALRRHNHWTAGKRVKLLIPWDLTVRWQSGV